MHFNTKKIMTKTLVFLMGLIFVLIIFEISLRFIALDMWSSSTSKSKNSTASYTAMSLGNSYTYGSGAPPGMDYSHQLQAKLNSSRKKEYAVINRGLRNISTTFIVENLPE